MKPDLTKLFATVGIPETIQAGTLTSTQDWIHDEASLAQTIANFCGEGWICYSEKLTHETSSLSQNLGLLLSAELCKGKQSLHLRLESAGWRAVRFEAAESSKDWLVTHQRRAAKYADKILTYEVCWQLDSLRKPAAFAPVTSRFAGFSH